MATIFSEPALWYLLGAAVLLVMAAWTSAAEAAFFSLTTTDMEGLRSHRDRIAVISVYLLREPRLLLAALTSFKYTLLMGLALLSGFILMRVAGNIIGSLDILLISIALFCFVGEILPKVYGARQNVFVARHSARFCRLLIKVMRPLYSPLMKVSLRVEKRMEEITEQNSVEELSHALELASTEAETTEGEKEILRGIVTFGTLTVKQVMRHRSEISSVDIRLDFHQLMSFINQSGFSRIPVYYDTLDRIEGVLYIKDLLPFLNEAPQFNWQKLLRPGYFVPQSKKIDMLLKDFQEKRVHMALVVDDRGGTVGLITLENIIEEIIGDINDEMEEIEFNYKKIDDRTFVFDGKTTLHDFCKTLEIDSSFLNAIKVEDETLGGLVVELQHELPKVGDMVTLDPYTFFVEAVDRKRVKRIRIKIAEPKEN
ncbi:MAG: gliding motility-associated protein GldE [Bacteroidota bacterium]